MAAGSGCTGSVADHSSAARARNRERVVTVNQNKITTEGRRKQRNGTGQEKQGQYQKATGLTRERIIARKNKEL